MKNISSLRSSNGLSGVCVLLALAVGCGGGDDTTAAVAKANSTNLKRLANLYMAYQSQHDWLGPKNEAEFKAFIRKLDADRLVRINVDPNTLDSLFISERDSQPFKIRYSVRGDIKGSGEPVIFEATGVDGKRQVGLLNMTQLEVDAAQYDALWSGKPAPGPATRG